MTDDTRLTDALDTFLSEVRRHGPDRARDIISAWRDDENDGEDETTLNLALVHHIDEALMIAAEIDEDVTRSITIRDWTRGASRLHFSWVEGASTDPSPAFTSAIDSAIRTATGRKPRGLTLPLDTGTARRWRVGDDCGKVFKEGQDFDGLTVIIELRSEAEGTAVAAVLGVLLPPQEPTP
jgi:hypothetical protein